MQCGGLVGVVWVEEVDDFVFGYVEVYFDDRVDCVVLGGELLGYFACCDHGCS